MNWFLYDNGLRHERVKLIYEMIRHLSGDRSKQILFDTSFIQKLSRLIELRGLNYAFGLIHIKVFSMLKLL